jgi:hypothetical protein
MIAGVSPDYRAAKRHAVDIVRIDLERRIELAAPANEDRTRTPGSTYWA